MDGIYELQLKSLSINENGTIHEVKGNNVLTFSLLNPRPGTASVSSGKALKLKDQQTLNFESGTNPSTEEPYSWHERLVFKEAIVGNSHLVVQLTQMEKPARIEKIINGFVSGVFKAAFKLVTDGLTNIFYTAAVETASGVHAESLKVGDSSTLVIGRAEEFLPEDQLPAVGASKDFALTLKVPATVKVNKPVQVRGRWQRGQEVLLPKGQSNGTVSFQLRRIR